MTEDANKKRAKDAPKPEYILCMFCGEWYPVGSECCECCTLDRVMEEQ